MHARRAAVAIIAALFLLMPRDGAAQTVIWTETSTLGYAITGGSLGLAACFAVCGLDGSILLLIGGSTVAGGFVGHHIGSGAEDAARSGGWPTSARLLGVRIGTVTAFGGLGALFAGLRTNYEEGNGPGEDERLIRNYALIGGGVGVVAEIIQERTLRSRMAITPTIGRSPTGGLGVGLRIPTP